MNHKTILAVLAAGALAVPSFAADKQTVETLTQELEVGTATNVTLQFPVGDLAVTGGGGDKIKADVDIRCVEPMSSACRKVVEKVKIKVTRGGKGLVLKVDGWPRSKNDGVELAGRIEVPRALNLLVEVEVGDLTTRGIEGNLDVDVEVGNATIDAAEDNVGKVDLDAGVGKAILKVDGNMVEGAGLVGEDLKWTGKGKAMIVVDVNVGDILVNLE